MSDHRIPKQLIYDELWQDEWTVFWQRKRFKDNMKASIKGVYIQSIIQRDTVLPHTLLSPSHYKRCQNNMGAQVPSGRGIMKSDRVANHGWGFLIQIGPIIHLVFTYSINLLTNKMSWLSPTKKDEQLQTHAHTTHTRANTYTHTHTFELVRILKF